MNIKKSRKYNPTLFLFLVNINHFARVRAIRTFFFLKEHKTKECELSFASLMNLNSSNRSFSQTSTHARFAYHYRETPLSKIT